MVIKDAYRIAWKTNDGGDRKVMREWAGGAIKESEAIRQLERNNRLSVGRITHEAFMANIIWLGYWPMYASTLMRMGRYPTQADTELYSDMIGMQVDSREARSCIGMGSFGVFNDD